MVHPPRKKKTLYMFVFILQTGSDSQSLPAEEKGKSVEELEKPTIWKLTELSEPCKMRSMRLSDSSLTASVCIYLSIYPLLLIETTLVTFIIYLNCI